MSIYKQPHSANWFYKLTTRDGRVMRKTTGTADRDKAELIEKTFRLALKGTETPNKLHEMLDAICGITINTTPLEHILPEYEEYVKASGKDLVERTIENRRGSVRRLIRWIKEVGAGITELEQVDVQIASQFARYLANKGTCSKTRKDTIDNLSTVWAAMRITRKQLENPWPLVRPEVHNAEEKLAFTREQEKAILTAAEKAGKGWRLACMIARHTGLRYHSVAILKWSEFDMKSKVLRHTPPKTKRRGIKVVVPLHKSLFKELEKARREDPEGEYVLPLHEKAYHRRTLKTGPGLFAPILEAAQLSPETYTFHTWRHTFRTRLSEAGVSDDLAKRLGGWTENATASLYDHAERITELREAIDKAN